MNDSNGPVRGLIYLSAVDRRREAMTDPVVTTEPTTPPVVERPNPLMELFLRLGPAIAALTGVVGFLVPFGILSQAQADALTQFGEVFNSSGPAIAAAVSGLITAGSVLLATFAHAKLAKAHVTPVEDPRDNRGRPLTASGVGRVEG